MDNQVSQDEQKIKENRKSISAKMQQVIDKNYEMKKLGDVVEKIEIGNRPKGGVSNITSGALSLGGEHIHKNNGKINLEQPKYVPIDFYENSKRGILKENDILICKDGYPGKIALLKNELIKYKAMINEHVFLLRCDNKIKTKVYFSVSFL